MNIKTVLNLEEKYYFFLNINKHNRKYYKISIF